MLNSNQQTSDIKTFFSRVDMDSWSMWKARNEFIFQGTPFSVKSIALKMEQAWDEVQNLMIKSTTCTPASPIIPSSSARKWCPPDINRVKFNCDASWKKDTREGFGAVVLRNHKGELIDGRKFKVRGVSALACEAMALREACLMAKAMNLHSVQIECDNKELTSLSVSDLDPPWECACIIQDIRVLVEGFNLLVSWIPRSINRVAHWVASFVSGWLPQNWVSMIPAELSHILSLDL